MGTVHEKKEKLYRDMAIKAAKELCYGDDVIAKIKKAKNDNEIARIMATSRKRMRD